MTKKSRPNKYPTKILKFEICIGIAGNYSTQTDDTPRINFTGLKVKVPNEIEWSKNGIQIYSKKPPKQVNR